MRAAAACANVIWCAASVRAWRRMRAALADPAAAQRARLAAILRANADTDAGRRFGFARMRSIADYQSRVPVAAYDDITPEIDRVRAGGARVLTRDPVTRLVPSSGSTAAMKLVPYTRALQREIAAAVDAWIADLYWRRPALMGGRAYWSITPPRPLADAGVASAVPIGFDDDSRYLGGVRARLVNAVLVRPSIDRDADLRAYQDATLTALVAASDLRVISVWHPSLLAGLLDALDARWAAIVDRVVRAHRGRARELAHASPREPRSIWPQLRVVSCWADGPSRLPAADLARRLPGIDVLPKGLLATEGVVTIPFGGAHPIAVASHFYEFAGDDATIALAHELRDGREYRVILTTGGGLYRYDLGDRVRVTGRAGATPSLEFVGRDGRVSDLRGEKLSDGFVASAIAAVFARRPAPRFAMLAPEVADDGVGYVLFVDTDAPVDDALDVDLERELARNPHYAWCVHVGQLRPARGRRTRARAAEAFAARAVAAGQRLGDVKPVSLHAGTGWSQVLA